MDLGTEIALLARNPDECCAATSGDALIQNIDFRSTLCEAGGVAPSAEVEGRSFYPLLRGAPLHAEHARFFERNFLGEPAGRHAETFEDAFYPGCADRAAQYHCIRWWRPTFRDCPSCGVRGAVRVRVRRTDVERHRFGKVRWRDFITTISGERI